MATQRPAPEAEEEERDDAVIGRAFWRSLSAIALLGILGGVIAFGFLGLFLGPTLLAVGYSLVSEWTARHPIAERQKQA